MNRRTQKKLFLGGMIVVALGAIGLASYFGETSPVLVAGKVSIPAELESKATGIRTVYFVLHDVDSQMPMPWGAFQMRIRKDAKGTFAHFTMTKDNIQLMPAGQANPNPRAFRVKVRLDVDGMGGPDTAGDIVGEIKDVPLGTRHLDLSLNHVVGG